MPYRNGSAAGESDSGYDLTSESSPSLSQPTAGMGPSDSEAGPDIADEEFRYRPKDPRITNYGVAHPSHLKFCRQNFTFLFKTSFGK